MLGTYPASECRRKGAEEHTSHFSYCHKDREIDNQFAESHIATDTVSEHISCHCIAESIEEIGADSDRSDVNPRLVLEEITKLLEGEFLRTLRLDALLGQKSASHSHDTGKQAKRSSQHGILMLCASSHHLLEIRERN